MNVTSSVVLARMPLVAVYAASKTAIEGFTASLALELEDFDVSVKLVEPGDGPSTNFTSNGRTRMEGLILEDYARFGERVLADFQNQTTVTQASDVAETVWRAANDTTGQLRFPTGPDALALAQSAPGIVRVVDGKVAEFWVPRQTRDSRSLPFQARARSTRRLRLPWQPGWGCPHPGSGERRIGSGGRALDHGERQPRSQGKSR